MGNMQAGLETLNQQRCSPGSCHSVALKACCSNKTFDPLASCEELRVSSSLQGSTLPKMGLPRATAFRFGQGHSEAVFNFYFNSMRDQNGRAKSTRWSVWQPCFWGCDMTLRTSPAASKVHQNNETTKAKKHKHPCAELGRTTFGSPKSIYISNPKNGHQTNRTI